MVSIGWYSTGGIVMSSPTTEIRQAIRRYYRSFEVRAGRELGSFVKVSDPKVRFVSGKGWEINGSYSRWTWRALVECYDRLAAIERGE
jgi:hypothetical protein